MRKNDEWRVVPIHAELPIIYPYAETDREREKERERERNTPVKRSTYRTAINDNIAEHWYSQWKRKTERNMDQATNIYTYNDEHIHVQWLIIQPIIIRDLQGETEKQTRFKHVFGHTMSQNISENWYRHSARKRKKKNTHEKMYVYTQN